MSEPSEKAKALRKDVARAAIVLAQMPHDASDKWQETITAADVANAALDGYVAEVEDEVDKLHDELTLEHQRLGNLLRRYGTVEWGDLVEALYWMFDRMQAQIDLADRERRIIRALAAGDAARERPDSEALKQILVDAIKAVQR